MSIILLNKFNIWLRCRWRERFLWVALLYLRSSKVGLCRVKIIWIKIRGLSKMQKHKKNIRKNFIVAWSSFVNNRKKLSQSLANTFHLHRIKAHLKKNQDNKTPFYHQSIQQCLWAAQHHRMKALNI